MRALRSRMVNDDSESNKSDTEKTIKKEKHNKKSKKTSKRKPENVSTESDILMKSSELIEHKKTRKNKEFNQSESLTKSKKTTRHSTNITKDALKENISPNIKEASEKRNVSENDAYKKLPKNSRKIKKIPRRNKKNTSEESLEFKNVVTSTAMKPKKTRNSNIWDSSDKQESQSETLLSRKISSVNRSQNFDVTESKPINNEKISLSSTFEKTLNNQEYSPNFKNIVTSTTIKPKKRTTESIKNETKSTNTSKEAMEIDVNDNKSGNILLKNDIINISDGIAANTIKNQTNLSDVLNSTYLKIDNESPLILSTNNSGQWSIEEKSIINISDDTKMLESNLNFDVFTSPIDTNKDTKKVFFQDEYLSKSARKKWQRFPRNSQGANSILEQISTPQKKSLPNKSLNISQKLNKTGNTTLTTQSANKIKRTAMPNFARIHQKAYEKMESISEYSQRKKDRAILLLSNKKDQTKENEASESKIKSSRQLFTNEKPNASKTNFNRFGFKIKSNPITNKPPEKPLKLLKPSIYDRQEVVAIANKNVQNTGKLRDNKRDLLKGVRTNRRFDLLMKMRKN